MEFQSAAQDPNSELIECLKQHDLIIGRTYLDQWILQRHIPAKNK